MLYTITQIKRGFMNMVYLGFQSGEVNNFVDNLDQNQDNMVSWDEINVQNEQLRGIIEEVFTLSFGKVDSMDKESFKMSLNNKLKEQGLDIRDLMKNNAQELLNIVEETHNATQTIVLETSKDLTNTATSEVYNNSSETLDSNLDNLSGVTLRKGAEGKEVRLLQTYLKNLGMYNRGIDGDFGSGTERAVKALQGKARIKVDGVFGRNTLNALREMSGGIFVPNTKEGVKNTQGIYERTEKGDYTYDQAHEQTEKTKKSILDLETQLKITKELNEKIAKYGFAENRGYSIEKLVRKLTGNDKYSEILKNVENTKNLLNGDGKDRLENAVEYLTGYNPESKGDNFSKELDYKKVMGNATKILPWLAGVYLGDIPLPFVKNITNGADINKSVAFKNWIDSGMKGEFKDYFKQNKKEVNPVKEQYTLREILAGLNIGSSEQNKILAGKIRELNPTTQKLLKTYIADRLIPDLQILQDESYNAFEKGAWYTLGGLFGIFKDNKAQRGGEIISKIKENLNAGNTDVQKLTNEIFHLLIKEGEVDEQIKPTINRTDYMRELSGQNEVLQSKFARLLEIGAQEFNYMFLFDNTDDIKELGANPSDKVSLDKLKVVLAKNPISKADIQNWITGNPSTYRFIKALGSKQDMIAYKVSKIKGTPGLIRVDVGNSKHGLELTGNISTDLNQMKETSPDGKISTLQYIYKGVLEKSGNTDINLADLEKAFAGGKMVNISSLPENINIINTGRKKGQESLTTFGELASKRGDKEIFKMEPIKKEYTVYQGGEKVTIKTESTIYLRPDCANLIIVPNSVHVLKEGKPVQFDNTTFTQIMGKLPIVIPWGVFGGSKSPGTPTTTPGVTEVPSTTPGVTNTVGSVTSPGVSITL